MRRPLFVLPLTALLAGCSGVQAMSEGAGFGSHLFNQLMLLFVAVTGISYALVLVFLTVAVVGRRNEGGEARLKTLLIAWVGFILIGLILLTIASFFSDRSEAREGADQAPLKVTIGANQWWWSVEYQNLEPTQIVHTANELHLPVGKPVQFKLNASDVIHSLWIPALAGKQDLIPGRENDVRIVPTRIGHYRAQCAEYCGLQHAHMAFDVTVESPKAFAAWYAAQLKPAPEPADPGVRAGRDFFMTHACANCHSIAGTPASGRTGPDLTHVASRSTIAAGTLPMSRGNLMGWIANPQGVKPGARMPAVGMTPDELHAVASYLETLK
jgi:cytochrome c oxidase subunit II